MIAPFWAEFHGNELMNERTMFCFRIPDLEHRKIVQKDVVGLEPELLLFLRQLRCISVTIQSMVGITEKYHTLERHDEVLGNLRRTSLARYPPTDGDACAQSFVVCQHTAKNMPFEPKRYVHSTGVRVLS